MAGTSAILGSAKDPAASARRMTGRLITRRIVVEAEAEGMTGV